MQNTVNLNLKKPDQNDFVNIGDINDNMDILDVEVAKKYVKPLAGIPSLDLDSATQAALKKAETALQTVTKSSVGLGNVDNTSDVNKPVSTAQQVALDKKANLASPSLTGTPTAPTAAESTNTQQIATTAFVDRAVKTHQADLVSHGIYGVATGTNALVMTDSKVTSYVDGMLVAFKNTTASTSATTLNINNLGAIPIINSEREAQTDLKNNGVYTVRYSDGNFILQGSQGVSKTTQISNLSLVSNISGSITVSWVNPVDDKFKGLVILAKKNSIPTSVNDGVVIYDSNDTKPLTSKTYTGLDYLATYHLRAFAYTYKNATRVYTETQSGATISFTTVAPKGMQTFTSSGTFTVPKSVTSIDVFAVGGGGAGGTASGSATGGGGAGGYTATLKSYKVTEGTVIPVVVGSGSTSVNYGPGGDTIFGDSLLIAKGGNSSKYASVGGSGGSGGGATGGGPGGSNGSNGGASPYGADGWGTFGIGQGSTTRAFGESNGTLYAGGGGGGYNGSVSSPGGAGGGGAGANGNSYSASHGTSGTGGGGGGSSANSTFGNGGSGVLVIRWGY